MKERFLLSVVVSIVVHGLLFLAVMVLLIVDLPIFNNPEVELAPTEEPEVTVIINPVFETMLEEEPKEKPQAKEIAKVKPTESKPSPKQPKPAPKPVDQPKPKEVAMPVPPVKPPLLKPLPPEKSKVAKSQPKPKRQFARTTEDQEGVPDQETNLLGERDTRGASELAPDANAAANTASQDGVDSLFPGQMETVEKTHKDGSVGMDKSGEETETPLDKTPLTRNNDAADTQGQAEPEIKTLKPDSESSSRPKSKHLAQGKIIPQVDGGEGKAEVEDQPKAKKSPENRPEEGGRDSGKGKIVEQTPKKDGFSGYSRKNKVTGSISRRGKSSLNVKDSPLGRYQSQVSKAVELQWRRNCEKHRDHIVPGVISLRFYVDDKGKVSGIKFQEVIESNFIEQGFTQRAIRQAKLPKMPKSVVKELDGEPLELMYNFYF